jgi:hypothetical protein
MKMVWAGMWYEWERREYKVSVGNSEVNKPLGRRRRRWEEGIRMDLGEIHWEGGVDSAGSICGPLMGFCEYDNEPSSSGTKELVCA